MLFNYCKRKVTKIRYTSIFTENTIYVKSVNFALKLLFILTPWCYNKGKGLQENTR